MISHFRYTSFNEFSSSAPFRTNASILLQVLSEVALLYLILWQRSEGVFSGLDYQVQGILVLLGQFCCLLFFAGRFLVSPGAWVAHFRKYKSLSLRGNKESSFGALRCAFPGLLLAVGVGVQLAFLNQPQRGLEPRILLALGPAAAAFTPLAERAYFGRRMLYHTRAGWATAVVGLAALLLLSLDPPGFGNLWLVLLALPLAPLAAALRGTHCDWLFSRALTSLFRFSGLEAMFAAAFLAAAQLALALAFDEPALNPARAAAAAFAGWKTAAASAGLVLAAALRALAAATIQQHASAKKRLCADLLRTLAFGAAWQFLPLPEPDARPLPARLLVPLLAALAYLALLFANVLLYEVHPVEAFGLNRFFGRYFSERPASLDLDTSRDISFMA